MTLVKNFPGNKNKRRKAVVARVLKKKNPTELETAVIKLLQDRISMFPSEGVVFTKKDRSAAGKRSR